jgi:hypothetical protein
VISLFYIQCGKSAAVFACAREQGFNVIEVFPPAFLCERSKFVSYTWFYLLKLGVFQVNTSDMRNGAYVRQKFEEATKSHGLEKWFVSSFYVFFLHIFCLRSLYHVYAVACSCTFFYALWVKCMVYLKLVMVSSRSLNFKNACQMYQLGPKFPKYSYVCWSGMPMWRSRIDKWKS